MTVEGFVLRLIVAVLVLVLYNLISARAALKPDQEHLIGWIVLAAVAVFLLFGGVFFPGSVFH